VVVVALASTADFERFDSAALPSDHFYFNKPAPAANAAAFQRKVRHCRLSPSLSLLFTVMLGVRIGRKGSFGFWQNENELTPAQELLSPCPGLHVFRRERVSVASRSRAVRCRPVSNPHRLIVLHSTPPTQVTKEWASLRKNLPDTIWCRCYEDRTDCLRVVMVGAEGTPYHDGLYFFDVRLPAEYPHVPPEVYYHSGGLRINPNLYENGKVGHRGWAERGAHPL
jgi:hypothetical protein